jgi:hypothetical protein
MDCSPPCPHAAAASSRRSLLERDQVIALLHRNTQVEAEFAQVTHLEEIGHLLLELCHHLKCRSSDDEVVDGAC